MAESMLRKGTTAPDGTYTYKCGCCFEIPSCPYCYGGDLAKCQEAIKTARGQVYYGLLKTILSHVGKQMVDECHRFKADNNFMNMVDIGYLSLKYKLNLKATMEWLEETRVIKAGSYEKFQASKFKVRDVYAAAQEKYPITS